MQPTNKNTITAHLNEPHLFYRSIKWRIKNVAMKKHKSSRGERALEFAQFPVAQHQLNIVDNRTTEAHSFVFCLPACLPARWLNAVWCLIGRKNNNPSPCCLRRTTVGGEPWMLLSLLVGFCFFIMHFHWTTICICFGGDNASKTMLP